MPNSERRPTESRLHRQLTPGYPTAPRGERVPEPQTPPGFTPPGGELPGEDGRDDELGSAREGFLDAESEGGGTGPRPRRPVKARTVPADPEFERTWGYIKSMTGKTIKIKVAKMEPNGRFSYLANCPQIDFNPANVNDLLDIQDSVAKLHGPGDYRFTLYPPKELNMDPHSYSFSYSEGGSASVLKPLPLEPDDRVAVAVASSPVPDAETAMPANLFIRAVDLMQKSQGDPVAVNSGLMAIVTDLAERDRVNAETISALNSQREGDKRSLEIRELNARFERQSKQIEDLLNALKNPKPSGPDKIDVLIDEIRKGRESPPPDPNKSLVSLLDVVDRVLSARMPPAPSSAPTDGKSDFERTMELTEKLGQLIDKKGGSAAPHPASVSETIVMQSLNALLGMAKDGGQQPKGKAASLTESIELLEKLSKILKPGIGPAEAVRQIEEAIEEEPEKGAGKFAGILAVIGNLLSAAAKNWGEGMATGLAQVAPQIVSQITNPGAASVPAAQVVGTAPPPRRVTARAIPVIPKATVPIKPPTTKQEPVATSPINPENKTEETSVVSPDTETVPGAVGVQEPKPEEFVTRPKQLLGTRGPAKDAGGPTVSDADFSKIKMVLSAPLSAKDVASTLFATMPANLREHLKLSSDEAYAKVIPYLTEEQRKYAEDNLPRIKEVFEEIGKMVETPGA